MPVDSAHTNVNDRFTYIDENSLINLNVNVINMGGDAGRAVASGLWPAFTLDAVFDDGLGGQTLYFRSLATGQDSECIMAFVDGATFALKSTFAMFGSNSYPYSYAACHFSPTGGGGYIGVNAGAETAQLGPIMCKHTLPLRGPFQA